MPRRIKSILQYMLMLSVSAFLVWLSLKEFNKAELLNQWHSCDKRFLLLSGLIAISSHYIRGVRWKLLLEPLGYNVRNSTSFYSVIIGYFVNLGIPRGGELSRCYNLYKTDKVPINISLGTVIAERIIDFIFLIGFILAAFLIEFDNLILFFNAFLEGKNYDFYGVLKFAFAIGSIFALIFLCVYLIIKYKKKQFARFFVKLRNILRGIKSGLTIVFRLKRKTLFIFYSILIWLCYYFMTYTVMLSFESTAVLGPLAAVSVFAVGGVAMAVPLPGGTGSFHTMVPPALILLYGVLENNAKGFAAILHAWQTLIIIVFGIIAMALSKAYIDKRANKK